MSSTIEVKRICQYCGKDFLARTTVTKYCSHDCSRKAYRERIRTDKVKQSDAETKKIQNQPIEELKAKEYLNINEVCRLIGICRRTVYRLIEQGSLSKVKIGSRTIIKRAELNRYIDSMGTKNKL